MWFTVTARNDDDTEFRALRTEADSPEQAILDVGRVLAGDNE